MDALHRTILTLSRYTLFQRWFPVFYELFCIITDVLTDLIKPSTMPSLLRTLYSYAWNTLQYYHQALERKTYPSNSKENSTHDIQLDNNLRVLARSIRGSDIYCVARYWLGLTEVDIKQCRLDAVCEDSQAMDSDDRFSFNILKTWCEKQQEGNVVRKLFQILNKARKAKEQSKQQWVSTLTPIPSTSTCTFIPLTTIFGIWIDFSRNFTSLFPIIWNNSSFVHLALD